MGGALFAALFGLMAIGIPIAFAITLAGSGFLLVTDMKPLILVAQRMVIGMNTFVLLAIPLFIMAGYIMEYSGMSKKLINWVQLFVGWLPGSIGMVGILSSALFAALTGSGPATVAAIGGIMIPSMIAYGYKPESATGLIAAAGALGPVIPPSVAMIVYGSTMGLSIPKMFIGAIIPGLIIMLAFMITNFIIAKKEGLKPLNVKYTAKDIITATKSAFLTLMLPILIIGGIYGGFFTPTEAATVAVLYSTFLGFLYKELTFANLKEIMIKTAITSATVVFILAASNLFAWLLSATQTPTAIANAIIPFFTSKLTFLIFLNIFLFVVGALMDTLPSIVILAPILVPIGIELGCDPLHLGVCFCINLIIGFITPPFGCNLFTAVSVSGLPYSKVVKGVLPYMLAGVIAVWIIVFVPELVLWLPSLGFGG